MSDASLSLHTGHGGSFSDVVYRLTKLSAFSPAARAYRARYAQAKRELEAMSHDELAEYGIFYSDIRRVAHEMASQI